MKRISLFVRDLRDLREERGWSEVLSARIVPVVPVPPVPHTIYERRWFVLLVALVFAGLVACERTPEQAPEAGKAVVAERSGVLRLTPEELALTAIEVAPVARGELSEPREFPATVQSNENELATVLVRRAQLRTHEPALRREQRASLDEYV